MCSVANHYCRVSFTVILFTCALFFVVVERILFCDFWHLLYTEFCVYQCVENELHESEHTIFLLWYTSALFTNFDSFVILVYISMYQVWCVPFTELHKHAYSYCFTIAHLK